MRCRHFFSFVLVLFLSFFFGSFIITNNTFAVDDITTTLEPGSSFYACSNFFSEYPNCSDFDYLILSPDSSSESFFRFDMGAILRAPTFTESIYFIRNVNYVMINDLTGYDIDSLTITLTNSLPGSSTPPSGNLDITENGTYDVTNYATATVDVPAQVIQGDYHGDLVSINNSILVCGAILLVLYFFYCIYRLIIKNSGVH